MRSTFQASGSSTTKAMLQRKRLSANGEIRSLHRRPTMALPAHSKGGKLSIAAVEGFKEEFISLRLYLCPLALKLSGRVASRIFPAMGGN